MKQVSLDFEAGLIDRFPEWDECVRHSVSSCGRQHRAIAAELDMSPSELSRKIARKAPGSEEPNFPFHRIPDLIHATGQLDPIYWLIDKFCDDPERKKRAAIAQIPALIAKLEQIAKEAAA